LWAKPIQCDGTRLQDHLTSSNQQGMEVIAGRILNAILIEHKTQGKGSYMIE
jgi:hypothetical protein